MGNISREMEILRESRKEMQEINNSVRETKSVLFGVSSRLDTAEERISALDHILKKKKKNYWSIVVLVVQSTTNWSIVV